MSNKNDSVEQAIAEARKFTDPTVSAKAPELSVGNMVRVTPVVPQMFDGEGRPYPKREINRQVEAFCEEQKKGILTHSIALGLGIDMPTGLTFDEDALNMWLKHLGYNVKRVEGDFTVVVEITGGKYEITDTSRYMAGLRAIHFALLRHDPDTDEYVQRRLFEEVSKKDPEAPQDPAADQVH